MAIVALLVLSLLSSPTETGTKSFHPTWIWSSNLVDSPHSESKPNHEWYICTKYVLRPISMFVLQRFYFHFSIARWSFTNLKPITSKSSVQSFNVISEEENTYVYTEVQIEERTYLVNSVPPSSAGGVQLTTTLSWKISVTLHDNGGVGLSKMKRVLLF